MLRDIGVTQGDVRSAMASPLGEDPSYRLGAMAREQELGGLAAAQQSNALDALASEYARVAAALQELSHG